MILFFTNICSIIAVTLTFGDDEVPKEDGVEVQELRFSYGEIPNELSPPDKPIIHKFLERVLYNLDQLKLQRNRSIFHIFCIDISQILKKLR